ncbi:hypothetical protein EMMF5_006385 [Cystobasidiomycetes sp. EMM_F5]
MATPITPASQRIGSQSVPMTPLGSASHPHTPTSAHSVSDMTLIHPDTPASVSVSALPDPDKGYAWVYLAAAFAVETLAFGFTFSIGVLHEYWTSTLFPGNPFILTLVATMQSGLIYIAAIAIGPFYTRYPEYRAEMQYIGQAISTLGILLSGFATQPWHLIPTAGIMYPIGASAVYLPATTLLFEWFARKRGLANGLMYSGTGLGGAILPLVIQALLAKYSYKAAVVSLALGCGLLAFVSIYFIKERVPIPRYSRTAVRRRNKIPLNFIRSAAFWAFASTVALTSFSAFLPAIYVPTYAVDIGLSKETGTLMLVVMNCQCYHVLNPFRPSALLTYANLPVSSIFGQLMQGYVSDRFTATWTRLITTIAKDDTSSPPTIFGAFFVIRGVCSVLGGPISSLLLQGAALPDARFAYGVKNYGGMLLFIGCTNAAGSLAGLCFNND